jgi:hypothetical protein
MFGEDSDFDTGSPHTYKSSLADPHVKDRPAQERGSAFQAFAVLYRFEHLRQRLIGYIQLLKID